MMIRAAVIGATGYAGAELMKLLISHPQVSHVAAATRSFEGIPFSQVYPNFISLHDDVCQGTDLDVLADAYDVLFLSLPHGLASSAVTEELLSKTRIIDLGADFRLRDADTYETWYKCDHHGRSLLPQAVYGLSEIYREQIADAVLIANPGCYTTCSILSARPLVERHLIDTSSIIIDAASGVSGAGRKAQTSTLFSEVNESFKAYGVAGHRHTPEIEQELSIHEKVTLSFTPHLVPMNRGILATIYATVADGVGIDDIQAAYQEAYGNEYFIRVRRPGDFPETRHVKGSNFVDIGFTIDERTGRVIVIGAIDNIVKGAAGQAVQNMNISFGFAERSGLDLIPSMPL